MVSSSLLKNVPLGFQAHEKVSVRVNRRCLLRKTGRSQAKRSSKIFETLCSLLNAREKNSHFMGIDDVASSARERHCSFVEKLGARAFTKEMIL